MNSDKILLIPYLSKELNLIGCKPLPFKFKKKLKGRKSLEKEGDSSDSDSFTETPVQIIFNTKKMITQLVSASIELINRIKSLEFVNEDDFINKLRFENIKLEKKLNSFKRDEYQNLNELAKEKEKNHLLQEKLNNLEGKLKNCELEINKMRLKQKNSEQLLRNNLKKQDLNLKELHTIIWKQFNMGDKNYFPENFKIIRTQDLNFSKLWSEVRYSKPTTKENALKKAVCLLQENNNLLMEELLSLINLLLVTLENLNDLIQDMSSKMHLKTKSDFSLSYKINDLSNNLLDFDIAAYKKIIERHFLFFKNMLKGFEEASFTVSDKLFVCWSDVVKHLQ